MDIHWMQEALKQAQFADQANEVPVGAVVVYQNEIVGWGFNSPISRCNPVAHAEILALQRAAERLHNYRLVDCDLYVTLEPCTMCAGAIVHSRVRRLIFGAYEPKAGAVESQSQVLEQPEMNHHVEVVGGVLAEESSQLLSAFFRRRRQEKKALKRAANLQAQEAGIPSSQA